MQIARSVDRVRRARREHESARWGLVPTMGFLHAGHLELVRRAREECERVAVSIFVNPRQFERSDDLERYPRALERDLELLAGAGVDLAFCPATEDMYPAGFQTTVSVGALAEPLEGAARPGHFDGVATVVAKLFCLLRPARAYFGQKDAQQCIVVERMTRDLGFDLEIVVCPTVREPDGLAMSSRNARLTPEQRRSAPALHRALERAAALFENGETEAETLREAMRETIGGEPLARVDYVSVADPRTLAELETVGDEALLSLAVFYGSIRLIDNLSIARGG